MIYIIHLFLFLLTLVISFDYSWSGKFGSDTYTKYDKSINLFSPNGDLLQVGYAEIASERGYTAVCIPNLDNSLIVCVENDPDIDILTDKKTIDKLSRIDDNIWLTFSGLAGDGRAMIRSARSFCAEYHSLYGCSPSVSTVSFHLGEIQHKATLAGDERPLGVHMLLCGFDEYIEKPKIFTIRASGRVTEWKACSVGRNSVAAMASLENKFNEHLSVNESIAVAIEVIKSKQTLSGRKFDLFNIRRGRPSYLVSEITDVDQIPSLIWKERGHINST